MRKPHRVAFSTLLLAACAGGPREPLPELSIPWFRPGDPVIESTGFVRHTQLTSVEDSGTTFILMAWAVGEALTFGAMTKGEPFRGEVEWTIGDARFEMPYAGPGAVPIKTNQASAGELVGRAAGFRNFDWVNFDPPPSVLATEGETEVRLEFRADDRRVTLGPFRARIARPQ
ncbi:MAG: hypothetical protein KDB80_09375 [Planctomycetes bacterium]|nr:hypothetical protein [Planctomycetota bacterium]